MSPRTGRRVSSGRQRRRHRHARRRPVLRDGARRHVQVHLGVLEEVRIDAVRRWRGRGTTTERARADSFITSPSWPVSVQRPAARHARRLDEQHVAAGRRPRQADGDARILRALLHLLVEEARRAEHLDDHVRRDRRAAPRRPRRGAARPCGRARRSRARGCGRRPRGCSRESRRAARRR